MNILDNQSQAALTWRLIIENVFSIWILSICEYILPFFCKNRTDNIKSVLNSEKLFFKYNFKNNNPNSKNLFLV